MPRAQTDSLATVVSGVSGHGFANGAFRFDGLPPGDYLIEVVRYETTGKDGVWMPLGAPTRVEVAAGGTTRFSLER